MPENIDVRFYMENRHPKNKLLDGVGSALHSMCVTKSISWAEAYDLLIKASGELGQMPQNKKAIHLMLSRSGFYLQSGAMANYSISELIELFDSIFSDGEVVILNLSRSEQNGRYIPIVPIYENEKVRYVLKYPFNVVNKASVEEVWISWKDGLDHSIMPRRKRKTKPKTQINNTKDNATLKVYNENPNDNLIGDCVVRAVAGVFGISWAEAVEKLAKAQDYAGTIINNNSNIEALLRKEGFQEFEPIKRNGKILTGAQFCDLIHDMFQEGTKIFAYAGVYHVVAILVFENDYKIVDTWDSTNEKIIKYWAKFPEVRSKRKERKQEPKKDDKKEVILSLDIGTRIKHDTLGEGEIIEIGKGIVTINFTSGMQKKLSEQWVLANCSAV